MAATTFKFKGQITLENDDDRAALNRVIDWSENVQLSNSPGVVPNPVTQEQTFLNWILGTINGRIAQAKREIAQEKIQSSGVTVSVVKDAS